MDFAKKQLEKYGWSEGKGLGKTESGMSTAIKPKLKFNKAGIGHDCSEQFTNNWWENVYNKASSNVNVIAADNGNVELRVKNPDAVEITTRSYSLKNLKKESNGLQYGCFLKTSKLTETGVVQLDNNVHSEPVKKIRSLTDDELFAACGGRTAHKGARHGIQLNGKLSRLEQQEKLLLKKLKKVSLLDETESKKKNLEKKLKKIADHKKKTASEAMEEDVNAVPSSSQCTLNIPTSYKCGKKRKKDRKRVSFSETVTEYQTQDIDAGVPENQTQDLDSSSQSDGSSRPPTPVTTVRQVKIKDKNESPENNTNLLVPDQDEGIDCSEFNSAKKKDTNDLQAKIRKENRRMKRKLKKLRKRDEGAQAKAMEFIEQDFKGDKSEDEDESEKCLKCTKRKMKMEFEDCEVAEIKKCHYECDFTSNEIEAKGSSRKNKKEKKQQFKEELPFEQRIDNVTESLNEFCKISEGEN